MSDLKKIAKELDGVGDGAVYLIEADVEDAPAATIEAIRSVTKSGLSAIVISASRPYNNLMSLYSKSGIDTKKVYIIDCVTKASSERLEEAGNVVYLDSVSDLTTMSLALNAMVESIRGGKAVFLDSISTMLIYNRPDIFAKFIHVMLTKLRVSGVGGILISSESANNREVRAEIVQLCDRVIKV